MKAFNITSGKYEDRDSLIRVLVNIVDGVFEFGFCSPNDPLVVQCNIDLGRVNIKYIRLTDKLKEHVVYANYLGKYVYKHSYSINDLQNITTRFGRGNFPYSFNREYEAANCLELFNNRQRLINEQVSYNLSKYFKYSFGVEFETYAGYVPENECFRDGLIPLRDGSLEGGIEYSTIVLQGNFGLNLLNQQIDTLQKYTAFNKECSLHFHFGNFPVNDKCIWALYLVWNQVVHNIQGALPAYTFKTSEYKRSGKDYCKHLPQFNSFFDLYFGLTGQKYFGNLYQVHPKDPDKRAKWNINTRYFDLNLINILCYKGPKTVEFRFLRPTYNKHKIWFWLYVLNAVMLTAEKLGQSCDSLQDIYPKALQMDFSLQSILFSIYDREIANKLMNDFRTLQSIVNIQNDLNDYIGERVDVEDRLFDPNELIYE